MDLDFVDIIGFFQIDYEIGVLTPTAPEPGCFKVAVSYIFIETFFITYYRRGK